MDGEKRVYLSKRLGELKLRIKFRGKLMVYLKTETVSHIAIYAAKPRAYY
ncbi:MAG: hypothetical protein ACI97K_000110 [Glaciecola sp.]|jgi:hypothetical protein